MIETIKYQLPNGLRVVHNYDPTTAMVAVDILYNVGSRDESDELKGLAHLFEHLMFGGSLHIPDFDGEMERAGGINNAWTSNDFTNFYDYAPAQNFETLLWLESDRMLSPSFSDKVLDVQRRVVVEEFKETCLNRPYGDLMHRLRELVYRSHPYRYPTIGRTPDEIETVTQQQVKDFFFSHYGPNNAVLAVSGNVDPETLRSSVERWFGDIPRREISPRTYAQEPTVEEPRELVIHGRVPQSVVTVAFPMPGYGEKGYLECDLITDILAAGKSSRFYRRLVLGSDLFSQADAVIIGSEEPGMLLLQGHLLDPSLEAAGEAAARLIAEAVELCNTASEHPDGVTRFEVERAVNRHASEFRFANLSLIQRAQALAMAEMRGEDINKLVDDYRRVTPAEIVATARRVIDPSRASTLLYLPE